MGDEREKARTTPPQEAPTPQAEAKTPEGPPAAQGPAQPTPAQQAPTEPSTPEAQGETPSPAPPEAPRPSRFRRWIRRAVRTLVVLGVIYALGWLSALFVVVQPLEREYMRMLEYAATLEGDRRSLEQQLDQAEKRIQELEAQVQGLQQQIDQLTASQQRLEHRLRLVQAQRGLYRAMVALQNKDITTARLALQGTAKQLEAMAEEAPDDLADLIRDIHNNLVNLQPQLSTTTTTLQRLRQLSDQLEELATQWNP